MRLTVSGIQAMVSWFSSERKGMEDQRYWVHGSQEAGQGRSAREKEAGLWADLKVTLPRPPRHSCVCFTDLLGGSYSKEVDISELEVTHRIQTSGNQTPGEKQNTAK